MTLERTPPAPGVVRNKATKAAGAAGAAKAPLATWIDQEAPIPDDWAMSSPALETLCLVRHITEPPHRLSRGIRYMLMDWARHRNISLDDFLL